MGKYRHPRREFKKSESNREMFYKRSREHPVIQANFYSMVTSKLSRAPTAKLEVVVGIA